MGAGAGDEQRGTRAQSRCKGAPGRGGVATHEMRDGFVGANRHAAKRAQESAEAKRVAGHGGEEALRRGRIIAMNTRQVTASL